MPLRVGTPMPSLEGATLWMNGEVTHNQLRGNPTLIHFWAVSCPICKTDVSTIQQWKELYGPQGLRVVAIHMPRGQSDTDVEAVKTAVQSLGITHPCAVDNDHAIGNRFQTGGVWPCCFLFDHQGNVRRHAPGSAGLPLLQQALKRFLILEGSD